MSSDRFDWIFDSSNDASLAERYDTWAATYAADHDAWGWRGPDLVAAATMTHLTTDTTDITDITDDATIIDADHARPAAGVALRNAKWSGKLIGLDLTSGMLNEASKAGAYDHLIRCSLYDIPLRPRCAVAVVSAGVFTAGHVGGEALPELHRITRAGGVVTVTQRLDFADDFAPHIGDLVAVGAWVEIDRTAPEPLHPDRNDNLQRAITWRCAPR